MRENLHPLLDPHLSKLIVICPTGCWIWCGARHRNGYGHINRGWRDSLAHRFIYSMMRGRIPEGLTIDHLCRVRLCVNPDHLQVVSLRENIRRGFIVRGLSDRCRRGHDMSDAYISPTRRYCRPCKLARNRKAS